MRAQQLAIRLRSAAKTRTLPRLSRGKDELLRTNIDHHASTRLWALIWPSLIYLALLLAWVVLAWPPPMAFSVQGAEMALAVDEPRSNPAATAALKWQKLDQQLLAQWRGPYWLRYRLELISRSDDRPLSLALSLRAASDIYWNGSLLGRNGRVANSAALEQPGRIEYSVALNPPIQRSNVLLIRASSQQPILRFQSAGHWLLIAPTEALAAWRFRPWLLAALTLGALVVALGYLSSVQHNSRRGDGRNALLMLGAASALLLLTEASRAIVGYSYPWHGARMILILSLQAVLAFALPYYLHKRFGVSLRARVVALYALILALAMLLPWSFDARGLSLFFVGFCACLVLLILAPERSLLRARLLLLVALGFLATAVLGAFFLDGPHIITVSVLSVILLLQHGAVERRLAQRLERLAAQKQHLSLQLLRRALQPHWLMNTLTALQELIETDQQQASVLVEQLSELFAQFRQAHSQALIPIGEEVSLCQRYLDVVGGASQIQLCLHVEMLSAGVRLPVGLLHTQIENALTHAGVRACAAVPFRLRVERIHDQCRLHLWSALATSARPGHGTGTAYITESLAMHSNGDYRFHQGVANGQWFTEIEFRCAS